VEKFMDQIGSKIDAALATGSDSDFEAVHGLTPTAQAAMLMRRYMFEFDAPRIGFAEFPVQAHANGVANPNAMFRRSIKTEIYERAAMVSDPLNMFDVAPIADGSAAVLLTRPELLPPNYSKPLVRIAGSSLVTDTLALHDRPDPLVFHAARLSVERACQRARVSPLQVDLFELHDAYSIFAVLSLEAAGFANPGEGWRLAQDSCIGLSGSMPISTMGGLKARGYPGGATGIYQAVEAVLQLRNQAGDNQIQDARRAMIQSLGGPASTAVTHLLEVLS
jgi:acetyl-CoA C-acetyltransferase